MKNLNAPKTQRNYFFGNILPFIAKLSSWIFWIIGIISSFYVILASFHSGTRLSLPFDVMIETNLEVLQEQMKIMEEYFKNTRDFDFKNFTEDLNFCYSQPDKGILYYSYHRTFKNHFKKDFERNFEDFSNNAISNIYIGAVYPFLDTFSTVEKQFETLNLKVPFKKKLIQLHKNITQEFSKLNFTKDIKSKEKLLLDIIDRKRNEVSKKIIDYWYNKFLFHSQHKTVPCFLVFLHITKSYFQLQINYIIEKKPALIQILTWDWFHYFIPIMYDEMANIQYKLDKIEFPLHHNNYLEFKKYIKMLNVIKKDLEKVKIKTIKEF